MRKRPDLTTATEIQLLEFVQAILSQVGDLTLKDKYELLEINDEFIRRQKNEQKEKRMRQTERTNC